MRRVKASPSEVVLASAVVDASQPERVEAAVALVDSGGDTAGDDLIGAGSDLVGGEC